MNNRENRRVERYSLRVPVKLTEDESGSSLEAAETRDVSSGGVFIETSEQAMGPGSKVNVELILTVDKLKELFEVSNKVKLTVEGMVTRATAQGLAVKFSSNYKITPVELLNEQLSL